MPKRSRDLFFRICRFSNLLVAYRLARRTGRSKPGPVAFDHGLEHELWGLRDELLTGHYAPGTYRSFYVHEPKRRLISAAPFRDRVVHHAVVRVLEPIFERRFIHDSYACRKGKGTHAAVARAHGWTSTATACGPTSSVSFRPWTTPCSWERSAASSPVGAPWRCSR